MKNLTVNMISQWQYLWKVLVFLYLPIALLFIAIGLLSNLFEEFTLVIFLRDSVTIGHLPFYAGFVPQLENIMWSASLTICMFMVVALKRHGNDFAGSRKLFEQMAIVTTVLLFDKVFLFHGEVAPKFLHINKMAVVAVYVMMIIFFLSSNWPEIRSSEYLLLLLAIGMFGMSVFFDRLPLGALPFSWQQLRYFLEDGSKFAGVATWLVYLSRFAFRQFEIIQLHSKNSGSV